MMYHTQWCSQIRCCSSSSTPFPILNMHKLEVPAPPLLTQLYVKEYRFTSYGQHSLYSQWRSLNITLKLSWYYLIACSSTQGHNLWARLMGMASGIKFPRRFAPVYLSHQHSLLWISGYAPDTSCQKHSYTDVKVFLKMYQLSQTGKCNSNSKRSKHLYQPNYMKIYSPESIFLLNNYFLHLHC